MSGVTRAALGVYSLAMRALQPLLRRKLQRRGREELGYLHAVEERFGQPYRWLWLRAPDALGG